MILIPLRGPEDILHGHKTENYMETWDANRLDHCEIHEI